VKRLARFVERASVRPVDSSGSSVFFVSQQQADCPPPSQHALEAMLARFVEQADASRARDSIPTIAATTM
jgi:hypothetical protein